MQLSRRHLLKLGGAALAGASAAPAVVRAQTPKRGGSLAIRTWDPPHFDPFQTISYKTHIAPELHPQPAAQAQDRTERCPQHVQIEKGPKTALGQWP